MSTGAEDGAYHAYALRYRAVLAEYGMELVLKPSKGALDNLERLRRGTDEVDALVQGGLARAEEPGLVRLGSLFFEPVWLFYRDSRVLERASELAGKRIAIGASGSGTQALGPTMGQAPARLRSDATRQRPGDGRSADNLRRGCGVLRVRRRRPGSFETSGGARGAIDGHAAG